MPKHTKRDIDRDIHERRETEREREAGVPYYRTHNVWNNKLKDDPFAHHCEVPRIQTYGKDSPIFQAELFQKRKIRSHHIPNSTGH